MTVELHHTSISVAHIDTSFVYQGDGDYRGLLHEVDLTDETLVRHDEALEWIAEAHKVAALEEEPDIPLGPHCTQPYSCSFCTYCQRDLALPEYPLSSLPRLHASRRERIEAEGHEDLRDVPEHLLNDIQTRVKQCSLTGQPYFDVEGLAADLAPYGFPAWFLDFESTAFAVPVWKQTRPFQALPFQFSLHRLDENGKLDHIPFLDLSGENPCEAFTRTLVSACGTEGPVFVYNAAFETRIMREIAAQFPEHAPPSRRSSPGWWTSCPSRGTATTILENGILKLEAFVPPNTTATLVLPGKAATELPPGRHVFQHKLP